jgi:hypothetical protein
MASHPGNYGEGNPPIPAIDGATVAFMINNSSAERRQLSGHIQYFLKTQSGRHLNADPG